MPPPPVLAPVARTPQKPLRQAASDPLPLNSPFPPLLSASPLNLLQSPKLPLFYPSPKRATPMHSPFPRHSPLLGGVGATAALLQSPGFDFNTRLETPSSKLLAASDVFSPSPKVHAGKAAVPAGPSRFGLATPLKAGELFSVENFSWAMDTPSALSVALDLACGDFTAAGGNATSSDDFFRHLMASPLALVRRIQY